jgi:hypothetical protein
MTKITHLDELLQLDDEQFVRAVYRTLFGRPVDPGGLVNYLRRLREGTSKLDIVVELRASEEGRARNAHLPGLETLPLAKAGPKGAARTLDELMSYEGAEFVACAYQTLLGRPADAGGLRHYGDQVRRHGGKLRVLAGLARSDEYRQRSARFPGLDALLQRHGRSPLPVLRRFLRALVPEGTAPAEAAAPAQPAQPAVQAQPPALASAGDGDAGAPGPAAVTPQPGNLAAARLSTLTPLNQRTKGAPRA